MFDDEASESPEERASDPIQRAKEKGDEFRMHAELYAVFEGHRKFDAQLLTNLSADVARDVQKRIAKLEKTKTPESPILPEPQPADAIDLLNLPVTRDLSTNDYHIHRRPGEVMVLRWLRGAQVDQFYDRMQAHVDVALQQMRDEERQAHEWRGDANMLAYLKALDDVKVDAAERYLRPVIRQHKIFVLSTVTVDEMDILHLCDFVMGVPAAEVVGKASAPPDEDPTEQDRAWFFKLFSLRGLVDDEERMCFFTYLQKSDDSGW